MSLRPTLVAFLIAAAVGIALLLHAAASDERLSAFSLDIGVGAPAAVLSPGHGACQGPITAGESFAGVNLWPNPSLATTLAVTIEPARGGAGPLARGAAPITAFAGILGPTAVRLDRRVAAGTAFRLCLGNHGTAPLPVLGSLATSASGRMRGDGAASDASVAAVFLRPAPRSLLSLLPTVFSRAALFKLGIVGTWTFWLLIAAIIAAFVPAGRAVLQAAREEESAPRANDQ